LAYFSPIWFVATNTNLATLVNGDKTAGNDFQRVDSKSK
jgi:hypothetical protein